MQVLERKSEKLGLAELIGEGRYLVKFDDGTEKEIAESTFKRLYTVLQEDVVVEVTDDVPHEDEPVPLTDPVVTEDESSSAELENLLSGAEEIVDAPPGDTAPPEVVVPEPVVDDALEKLGLNIELADWWMEGTKGGKTEKVKSLIRISDFIMEITEYDGYIADVTLLSENKDVPENDPDAAMEVVYRSPKMSLKDTLEWMGLDADDAKLARKEITAIRKAVKASKKNEDVTES